MSEKERDELIAYIAACVVAIEKKVTIATVTIVAVTVLLMIVQTLL